MLAQLKNVPEMPKPLRDMLDGWNKAIAKPVARRFFSRRLGIGFLLCILAFALPCCGSPPGFTQLASDASAVPVPPGVNLVREDRTVQQSEDFFSSSYDEVDRDYTTSLSCSELQDRWIRVLRRANRQFRLNNWPHLWVSSGSLGIIITDRGINLGITLGDTYGTESECKSPFLYAFG